MRFMQFDTPKRHHKRLHVYGNLCHSLKLSSRPCFGFFSLRRQPQPHIICLLRICSLVEIFGEQSNMQIFMRKKALSVQMR